MATLNGYHPGLLGKFGGLIRIKMFLKGKEFQLTTLLVLRGRSYQGVAQAWHNFPSGLDIDQEVFYAAVHNSSED